MNNIDLSFYLQYEKGFLSSILTKFEDLEANIISLSQCTPITNIANIEFTIDSNDMNISIDEFINQMKETNGVYDINIINNAYNAYNI